MQLAAWNIQVGGSGRIAGVVGALNDVKADVCVLSEYTTATSAALITALDDVGFVHVLHTDPAARWGGVLVASRNPIRRGEVDDCPSQDRWLHVVGDDLPVQVAAVHIPNAERAPTEKRLFWEWLIGTSPKLVAESVVIAGDFNTCLPLDCEGSLPPCADQLQALLDLGWCDVWRQHNEAVSAYSYWSGRPHLNGFRIDHALLSRSAALMCHGAQLLTSVRDRCIVHERRTHLGCDRVALSDHAMLVTDIGRQSVPAG